ncbi:hypothetical protein HYS72_00280 [Candidatus Pacearchaeota archaeon]|nr:hypothetical protein [Candidatus Pacearchaeota archaeon]MBI2056858.1 hypothetical protein [Candidatus Pacearchaeota archaeon]
MRYLIEVSEKVLKGLDQLEIPYNLKKEEKSEPKAKTQEFNKDDLIYVPSIDIYVDKERTHLGKKWFEAHKLLQEQGNRMLIIPEFIEFLKYTQENHKDIYNEITEVRNPWRSEWLDADFKVKNKKLYINYNHKLDLNGNLIPKNSEILNKNTLMEDKMPGISLENWLKNPTKQGLPNKNIKSGDLSYWYPRSNNNSVAWFYANVGWAGFDCNWYPSNSPSSLGVHAVVEKLK